MSGAWLIELLGGLRAERAGRCVTRFRTQQTAALIAYLAYHRRAHPREVLIDVIWPDAEPERGRHNLRQALSSLRRQIEPPEVPQGSVIATVGDSVELREDAVATDVSRFEAALAAARKETGRARARALEAAVALYGGDLLPGRYEDWVAGERTRLRSLLMRALHDAVELLERPGDLDRALVLAERAVHEDPLSDGACRDAMRLHSRLSRPSDALRAYRELERRLRREIGAGPDAETRALAGRIERGGGGRAGLASAEPVRGAAVPGVPAAGVPAGAPSGVTFGLALLCQEGGLGAVETVRGILAATLPAVTSGGAGQSITLSFARAVGALDGALDAHRALAERGVAVRMAIDAGEDQALEHALRLAQAAHPGEMLLSERAAVLIRARIETDAAKKAELEQLGTYRLSAGGERERLFELRLRAKGEARFPPPLAESALAGIVPRPVSRFFGREAELLEVERVLGVDGARLVTLTGPGGAGKTRLALEAAARLRGAFRGAVGFAPLADLEEPRLIAGAALDALGLARVAEREPMEQLLTALAGERLLLVLDNLEHLVARGERRSGRGRARGASEATAIVRVLLERIPGLALLATSRIRLGLDGERELVVPPLPVPENGVTGASALIRCPSVQLFLDRAQAARPDFQVTDRNADVVAELCARLEGIPLALELLAGRARVLSPAQMLEGIRAGPPREASSLADARPAPPRGARAPGGAVLAGEAHRQGAVETRCLDLLDGRRRDAPHRHASLRAAIGSSADLLELDQRRLFSRLTVFRGGFSIDAAAFVCEEPGAGDLVEELRDASLLFTVDGAMEPRFRMLEVIREFGLGELGPGDRAALGRRHAEFFAAYAERARDALRRGAEEGWLQRLSLDHDNLRAALAFSLGPGEVEAGLRIAAALTPFWHTSGLGREGERWIELLLARPASRRARAPALVGAAAFAVQRAERTLAYGLLAQALRDLAPDDVPSRGLACRTLAQAAMQEGDFERARRELEENLAIARRSGEAADVAAALGNLGVVAYNQGDLPCARRWLEESVSTLRRLAHVHLPNALCTLANVLAITGEYDAAERAAAEATERTRTSGDLNALAHALTITASTLATRGRFEEARRPALEGCAILEEAGQRQSLLFGRILLAEIALFTSDPATTRRMAEACLAEFRSLGSLNGQSAALRVAGEAAQRAGDMAAARSLHEESLRLVREMRKDAWIPSGLEALAAALEGDEERAVTILSAAAALRAHLGTPRSPVTRESHETLVASLRAALGDERFGAATRAGEVLSAREALAFALGEQHPLARRRAPDRKGRHADPKPRRAGRKPPGRRR